MSSPSSTSLARSVSLVLATIIVVAAAAGSPSPVAAQRASATGTALISQSSSSPLWHWPIEPPHPIVRNYVAPATRYSAGHRGIDIATEPGAFVLAPADGVVHFVGMVVDRPVVSLRHPGGVLSSFEPVSSELEIGSTVRRGERIGVVAAPAVVTTVDGTAEEGAAAHCRDPCLHFGVRLDGDYVSPMLYLVGIPRSVLLPTRPIRRRSSRESPRRTRSCQCR